MRRILQVLTAALLLPFVALYSVYAFRFSTVTYALGSIEDWSTLASNLLMIGVLGVLLCSLGAIALTLTNTRAPRWFLPVMAGMSLLVGVLSGLDQLNSAYKSTLIDYLFLVLVTLGPITIAAITQYLCTQSAMPLKLSLIPSKGFFVVSWAVLSALVVLITPASPRQILWDHSHRLNDLTGIIEHSYLISAPFLKYLKLGLYSGIIAQVLTRADRYHTAAVWCFAGLILSIAFESLSLFAFTHWGRILPEDMANAFYLFHAARLLLPICFLYVWSKKAGREANAAA